MLRRDVRPFAAPILLLLTCWASSLMFRGAPAHAAEQDPASLRNRGAALLDNGDDAKAIVVFRDLVRRLPSSLSDRVNLGIALLNHNDLDGAEAELRKALQIDSRDPRAGYNLGIVLKRRGKNEEAAALLEAVVTTPQGRNEASVHYNLGVLYRRLRKGEDALAAFRRCVTLRPEHASAHFQIYNELVQRGDRASAQPELDLFKILQKATPEFQRTESYLERGALTRIESPGPLPAGADLPRAGRPGGPIRFEVRSAAVGTRSPGAGSSSLSPAAALADFDGDSTLDLALASRTGETIGILKPGAKGWTSAVPVAIEIASAPAGGSSGAAGRATLRKGRDVSSPSEPTSVLASRPDDAGRIQGLAAGDVDNDGDPDLAIALRDGLRVFLNEGRGRFADATRGSGLERAPGARSAVWFDADRDGDLDLAVAGGDAAGAAARLYLNASVSASAGSPAPVGPGAAAPSPARIDRPRGKAAREAASPRVPPKFLPSGPEAVLATCGDAVIASDLRGRDDPDLAFLCPDGSIPISRNLRAGRFQSPPAGLAGSAGRRGGPMAENAFIRAGDLDGDGRSDLVVVAEGEARVVWNDPDPAGMGEGPARPAPLVAHARLAEALSMGSFDTSGLALLDADGDGDLDVATIATASGPWIRAGGGAGAGKPGGASSGTGQGVADGATSGSAGEGRLVVLRNDGARAFTPVVAATALPGGDATLLAGDLDGDGDPDLAAAFSAGSPMILANVTESGNRFVKIVLTGVKSNRTGVGAKVEARAERLVARGESDGNPVILGIGPRGRADAVQVVWTSGVSQDLIDVPSGPVKVEEKREFAGSCPFLYAWDGSTFRFLGEALSGAPVGFLRADGTFEKPRPVEHLRLPPGLPVERDGRLSLRMTEEMRELTALDSVRLVAVDHPEGVEVYSSERLRESEEPFRYLAVADLRGPDAAVELDLSTDAAVVTQEEGVAGSAGRPGASKGASRVTEERGTTVTRAEHWLSATGSRTVTDRRGTLEAVSRLDDRAPASFALLGARLEGLAVPHALVLRFDSVPGSIGWDPPGSSADPPPAVRGSSSRDARAASPNLDDGSANGPRNRARSTNPGGGLDKGERDDGRSGGEAERDRLVLVLDGWVAWTTSDVSRALFQAKEARSRLETARSPGLPGATATSGAAAFEPASGPSTFAGRQLPMFPEPWGPALEVRSQGSLAFEPDAGLPIGPSMLVPLPDVASLADVASPAGGGSAAGREREAPLGDPRPRYGARESFSKVPHSTVPPARIARGSGTESLEIRVGSNLAVYYDRARLGRLVDAPLMVREIAPVVADLRWRGVAASRRHRDDRPPRPDYDDIAPAGPFQRLPEDTTPRGNILSLVGEADGRFAIFGTGDEIALEFDASALPPPAAGIRRTWFLVSTGYARDGDPNTEPLPWGTAVP